jgi:hypothetical protein
VLVLAAAFCPHPPLLVPALAGAAAPELDGLRAACDEAVATIAAYGVPVLVLGPGPTSRPYASEAAGSLAPWGVDVRAGGPGAPSLPLSLAVGAWLLDRAAVPLTDRRYRSLTEEEVDLTAPSGQGFVLLVMADGSSTRTAKAPGGLNPAAEAYDAAVSAALAAGDPAALAALAEASTSHAVGAGGAASWRAAAGLLGGSPPATARLLTAEAPYGVAYPVAIWTWP